VALNSWQFLALAFVAAIGLPACRPAARTALLIGLNAVFASTYWGPSAAVLAVTLCLAGYAGARAVQDQSTASLVAVIGGLVGAFIYLRGYSFDGLSARSRPSTASSALAFAGLSFLFFRIVHVVVDSASGAMGRLSFWRFLGYCTNFTTLLMGPIQRYQDFTAQWDHVGYGHVSFEHKLDAANRILRGFAKAFAMAPWLRPMVLMPGLPIESLSGTEIVLRTYAFYVYLYLDFSGYCDIVIGLGRLMGLTLPENFRFPFLARNVSEYWLRVHRSLTQWLTDYIFTPTYRAALSTTWLGRYGFLALAASLVVTMTVAGMWHGTTLNFLVFGLVHGLALAGARGYELAMVRWLGRSGFRQFSAKRWVTVAATVVTYNFTSLAYTLFVLNVDESLRVFGRLWHVASQGLFA
jgi:D-alanyl-lipoteichoic acid acyltransferase DltB (MBOAT superfamily)